MKPQPSAQEALPRETSRGKYKIGQRVKWSRNGLYGEGEILESLYICGVKYIVQVPFLKQIFSEYELSELSAPSPETEIQTPPLSIPSEKDGYKGLGKSINKAITALVERIKKGDTC